MVLVVQFYGRPGQSKKKVGNRSIHVCPHPPGRFLYIPSRGKSNTKLYLINYATRLVRPFRLPHSLTHSSLSIRPACMYLPFSNSLSAPLTAFRPPSSATLPSIPWCASWIYAITYIPLCLSAWSVAPRT